jgi:integrase
MDQIERADIKRFLARKVNSGLTLARVKRIKATLSGIFAHAMEDGVVDRNPAVGLDRYLGNKDEGLTRKEPDPFTAAELVAYLDAARAHEPDHYPFFLTLARTGVRLSEALGLQWGDVDFHGGFIEIRRGLVDGKVTTPKSGKRRRVPMSPDLATALKEKKEAERGEDGPDWIFVNGEGRPLDGRNLRSRIHRRISERAGLRTIRLHDFRHTYATLRIGAGHNIAEVSKHLGHGSIKITIDLYHHWTPGQGQSEVAELDRLGRETEAKTEQRERA